MSDEKKKPEKKQSYRQRKLGKYICHCCKKELPYCLSCPCGFMICEECFKENIWGMSNGPTWICPDCERIRMT